MRLITLLIAVSLLSLKSYCQDLDSITQRDINTGLATGLNCCEQVTVCDEILTLKDSVIANQKMQYDNQAYKYSLILNNWNTADSLYRAANNELGKCNQETERLKKGKRNWVIITLFAIGGLAYMVFK